MALEDKIYAYFEREPRLRVLFVFDSDTTQSLTEELREIAWPEGYRLVVFDGVSWLGVKYAIEHEWKDERVVLVFHHMSPTNPMSAEAFPLTGLLAANAEYRSEGYEQFMQHNGIPEKYAALVRAHIEEFDRERFAKLLRPYFSATDFSEDAAMRGLMCGYMGESKMLTWEELILKLIAWDTPADEPNKKAEALYAALSTTPDVREYFNRKVEGYFGVRLMATAPHGKWREFVQAMKYNSITQLLQVHPDDSYRRLKVTDSTRLDRMNRLAESARLLPRQLREQYQEAYSRLGADVREDSLLRTYGAEADYYTVSASMADSIACSIAMGAKADPAKALAMISKLRGKLDEGSPVLASLDYLRSVALFYEKASRLGSVVFNTPDDYIEQYTTGLYLFDLYYRQSIQKYHAADDSLRCHSALESLKHELDKDYAHIANKINTEWVRCLKERGNGYGQITRAAKQEDIFRSIYDPGIKQAIIICDAFRFELAKELVERMAKHGKRFTTELSAGVAMLPTETKYCKSALLPHQSLELMDLTLSVDHKILNDTPSRAAHLASEIPGAKVIDFAAALTGTKETLRPLFTGVKLAVLFYDEVDHEGHGSHPRRVANTCAEALEDLVKAITKIHDHGNVAHVYLTSDHGFLYNDMHFEEKDKLEVQDSSIEKKSRYYLTTCADEAPGIAKFPMRNVSAMEAEVYVAVPEGTNRIKVKGGDYNFAHGGASLQEVIIPVLHTYSPKVNRKVPTGVTLLGSNHSIVSSRLKVKLLQNEAVSETIRERTVRCAIYDGETVVSTVKDVTLSSTNTDNVEARIFDVDLTLMSSGSGLLQLRVYDTTDPLNPLIKTTVTDNTLIPLDF